VWRSVSLSAELRQLQFFDEQDNGAGIAPAALDSGTVIAAFVSEAWKARREAMDRAMNPLIEDPMEPRSFFRDRRDPGRRLAERLGHYRDNPDVQVLALPRGGVPVAYEVARALHAPLDLFLVRKLGVPGHAEMAMGAVAAGGVRVLNDDIVRALQIPERVIAAVEADERRELARRERLYRDDRPPPAVRGRLCLLVDDGLATGATMHAAITALRQQEPARIVVAVAAAAPSTYDEFRTAVDEVICVLTPSPFYAVGTWYQDFSQTTDAEVRDLLAQTTPRRMIRALDHSRYCWRSPHRSRGDEIGHQCGKG